MYLDPDERRIRELLIEVARIKGVITYQGIISSLGLNLDMANELDRKELAYMLCEICRYEYEEFRPLLSVLVVNQSGIHKGEPSDAFFAFANKIGKFRDGDKKKFLFFEKNKCYAQWRTDMSDRITFRLQCKTCRQTYDTQGDKGNPPKKYCCGSEMKQIFPKNRITRVTKK